ncbi:hypothetical protein [Paenibacillus soyae]|uniref:Uncharacterized protein n=1 Tax=Paenibacillus soyae TaxID=2969249 RepID=A0A9X2MP50_9BACL|nr:hypothetical protein [Paenibacillus soyae]MCR2803642.1 hypothetical protein [Paenibacillus soyae]
MRASSSTIMHRLLDTGYIDAKLKKLSYDHESHVVRMMYGDPTSDDNDTTVFFKDCFSANFNSWLEGITGTIPSKPGDSDFFIHDILIQDVEINGVQLYKCLMKIPMMDSTITCLRIEIIS